MTPSDVVNRALDAIGAPSIGDLQEGTTEAKAALRVYSPVRQQLLRSAHWNFSRTQATLTMLNDATGQTAIQQAAAGYPVTVGNGTVGMRPWVYEYEWPTNGLLARWVPVQMYPAPTVSPPLMTGLQATPWAYQRPARFLVAQDTVPPFTGTPASWAGYPAPLQGRGRSSQTVILTNQPNATLVYTADILECDIWDSLFTQAIVTVLASFLAMPLIADKRVAMAVRREMVEGARRALDQARVRDGDEGWNQADLQVDWMRARNSGYGNGWGSWGSGDGPGIFWGGWGSCGLGDGSAY